ncbi:hypothetical protein G9A89_001943 [Geosiphon pyriformis]|nr:hypothetical protein G9A89_001943 [Geosiphon pyriformis]
MWNDISGQEETCDALCQYMIFISNWVSCGTLITTAWHQAITCLDGYSHDKNEIWWMANAKVEETMPSKILEIKNNPSEPVDIVLIPNPDAFFDMKTSLKKKEQEQCLEEINTRLCDHCLISCNFQYCNECDLIYNLPLYMIYTILEEEESINSCILKSESTFNPDSNSDNNDNENNDSSSAQHGKKNNSNSDSDSNSEQYIVLSDLFKEQELKWFSNNNKNIMTEHMHNTDAEFDLRYSKQYVIKLKPHSCTCINLKIAMEIPATTIVQLASRSSLVKKRINIRRRIIDIEYIENIIAMLQNNSEKTYIIEPNKKIAQAIFLFLVKIAQLVSMRNKEELGIMAKRIQEFGSIGRIDVPVNMTEKKVIDKREIIFTHQSISILPYNQYIIVIEKKIKDQVQIFETETILCESEKIGLVNLHIPAKNHSYIKILIYNNIGNIIKIPEETTIGYLTTKIED